MKNYYRVMLGKKSAHASECFAGNFIGADFDINQDLTGKLPDQWRVFNKEFIPIDMANNPGKSKISAGLACGALWTVAKGIRVGDLVLCPDGDGNYRVGEVTSEYFYQPGQILPHRRKVQWLPGVISRASMSPDLKHSTGSIGTVAQVSGYADEIQNLFTNGNSAPQLVATDPDVEDAAAFALEKHLEDFLVENWDQTELSKSYSIYKENGEPAGQQYATDAGPIDILAVSKDGKRLLVIELKRGRATDVVVGQTLRYMGFVKGEIAEPDQTVEGMIIALEDDQKLRWALAMVPNVSFYRYQVSFKLVKC